MISQVVAVYGTLSDLLSVASSKLGIRATSLYNGRGGLIDDIALIRWDGGWSCWHCSCTKY